MKNNRSTKLIIKVVTIMVTILLIAFVIYGIKQGVSSNPEALVKKIDSFGFLAPIFFILLQALQVIFPVIPGGASCLAGVLAFGGTLGFLYNYVGLTIGSVAAFTLSKKFGMKLIRQLFKEETIKKYLGYVKNKRFDKLFFIGILLPGLPDDLLCYLAGISNVKLGKFIIIILLGKPLTLSFYSFFTYLF